MTRESVLALLAAGSYWDIRGGREFELDVQDTDNRAPLPEGWKVLTQFDKSDSGPTAVTGFSARVYQNTSTNEIVISYAGTEFGAESSVGTKADFANGNVPLALGDYGSQAYRAAALYQEVKEAGLTNNIAFTGHSLGGGLASIMAVWFNRPAYVYAPSQRRSCIKVASRASSRYLFGSCLPHISLRCGPKNLVKRAGPGALPVRGALV